MKYLVAIVILTFTVYIPQVFAQGFVPLAPIPGLTDGVTADSESLANFFNNLYKYLIGLAAILAIIEIIWGGLEYATTDSIGNKAQGKTRIQQAIFGLILVLSPVLVFSIINPSILNLSLNLPPIKPIELNSAQPQQDADVVPEGGTMYRFGTSTPAGQWCFDSFPRNQRSGRQSVALCWPSEDACASVLSAAKADPANYSYSVNDRAQCTQR